MRPVETVGKERYEERRLAEIHSGRSERPFLAIRQVEGRSNEMKEVGFWHAWVGVTTS